MTASYTIGPKLKAWMCAYVPLGSTVLELGSGESTEWLGQSWDVVSIEEDMAYLTPHSLYHPIEDGWYTITELPTHDCLLVDGPKNVMLRRNIKDRAHMLNKEATIIFDDAHVGGVYKCAKLLSKLLAMDLVLHDEDDGRKFATLVPLTSC